MKFCGSVTEGGECIGETTEFFSDSGMMPVMVYVNNESELNTSIIDFKIYTIDTAGVEIYDNTISVEIQPNWGWFYKEIDFYEDALFKIYAYKGDGTLICSGSLDIYLWWIDDWEDY